MIVRPPWALVRSGLPAPTRPALLAAALYGALLLVLATVIASTLADLIGSEIALGEERRMQARFSALGVGKSGTAAGDGASAVLQGPTATIAGAELMERVATAVTRAGGRLTSSTVDVQAERWGPGFLSAEASFDMAEGNLQTLLYDIECGLPFLYLGELSIQGPAASDDGERRLRVIATIYGRWQGAP